MSPLPSACVCCVVRTGQLRCDVGTGKVAGVLIYLIDKTFVVMVYYYFVCHPSMCTVSEWQHDQMTENPDHEKQKRETMFPTTKNCE